MEAYGDLSPSSLVDSVHVLAELWPMSVPVSIVLGHEQQSVNHLMKKRLKSENYIYQMTIPL